MFISKSARGEKRLDFVELQQQLARIYNKHLSFFHD
jgi:hypothetical protein